VPAHLQLSGSPAQPWAEGLSFPWLASIALIHAGVFLALATSKVADFSDTAAPVVTMQVEMIAPTVPAPVRSVEDARPRAEPPPKKTLRPARKPTGRPLAMASNAPSQPAAADITEAEPDAASPDTAPTRESNDSDSRPSRESAAPAEASQPRFDAGYLKNPAPAYPSASRRLGEEGRVVLRVLVEADGRPGEVAIKTSSGFPRLDQAAEDAVRRWKFVPAHKGDEAVRAAVLVPIVFNLRD
jgi:protein TonB